MQIVHSIINDTGDYEFENPKIKDFLEWSLKQFADRIHPRELEMSPHLSDEALAFNYLCLLDENDLGSLFDTRRLSQSQPAG